MLSPGRASASSSSPRKRPLPKKEGGDEETARDVWMDPDGSSLDCGICFMPFEAQVFMCTNGHAACAECCVPINRKCWCCGDPIGDIRCRPAENMLAEMYTNCRFNKHGCLAVFKFVEKRRHEESCPGAPYACPFDGCSYRGTGLYEHVLDGHADTAVAVSCSPQAAASVALHKAAPFLVLLQEETRSVFLLLNTGGVLAGRSLSLVCLGPRPADGKGVKYWMEARGSVPGKLLLSGRAPCIRHLEGFQPDKFLFVPDADWRPTGSVSVSVRIGNRFIG